MGTDSQATDSSDTSSSEETSRAESTDSSSSSSDSDVARAANGAPTRPETWAEHVKNHGPAHHCARCVWAKEREKCEIVLVYQDKAGGTGSWVEEVCSTDTLWALRCKVCHWAGENRTKLGRGEARTFTETSLDTLRRHGNNRHSQARAGQRCTAYDRALLSLRQEGSAGQDYEAHVGGASCFVEMPDAPSWSHIAHVWNTVKSGESFRSFERNMLVSRATGAPIAGNRLSRKMCPKLLYAMAEELRSEDRMLLRRAQSIALTLDSRGRDIVCRVRMSLMELPAGVRPCHPSLCHETVPAR